MGGGLIQISIHWSGDRLSFLTGSYYGHKNLDFIHKQVETLQRRPLVVGGPPGSKFGLSGVGLVMFIWQHYFKYSYDIRASEAGKLQRIIENVRISSSPHCSRTNEFRLMVLSSWFAQQMRQNCSLNDNHNLPKEAKQLKYQFRKK